MILATDLAEMGYPSWEAVGKGLLLADLLLSEHPQAFTSPQRAEREVIETLGRVLARPHSYLDDPRTRREMRELAQTLVRDRMAGVGASPQAMTSPGIHARSHGRNP